MKVEFIGDAMKKVVVCGLVVVVLVEVISVIVVFVVKL